MSETKHTPGPWRTDHLGMYVTTDDHLVTIAVTHGWITNARLIAAAPELLAACEAAIAAGLFPDPSSVNHPERIEATRVSMMARAAIAKAKGE